MKLVADGLQRIMNGFDMHAQYNRGDITREQWADGLDRAILCVGVDLACAIMQNGAGSLQAGNHDLEGTWGEQEYLASQNWQRMAVLAPEMLRVATDPALVIDSADRESFLSVRKSIERCVAFFADVRREAVAGPFLKSCIDAYRADHHLTLEEFAAGAKIDYSALQRMRRGKFSYSTHTKNLKKVAEFMGCNCRDLQIRSARPRSARSKQG